MADDFTTPYSATDLAKALRVMIGIARELGRPLNAAMRAVDRQRARKPAAHLDTLAFRPGEMRQPIERIAAGAGSPVDLDIVSAMLQASRGKVERSIEELN
jgi:hypothetical protein